MRRKYELIPQNVLLIERIYQNGDERRIISPYRIKALIDIDCEDRPVHAGDQGGFVESEENLDHAGKCWIFDDAMALDDSHVMEDAQLFGESRALDNAIIKGSATLCGKSIAAGDSIVTDQAILWENAQIKGRAVIAGKASLTQSAIATDDAVILDGAVLSGCFIAQGNRKYFGNDILKRMER